jgi:hypothetical protein
MALKRTSRLTCRLSGALLTIMMGDIEGAL